jgi:hypothetical protein
MIIANKLHESITRIDSTLTLSATLRTSRVTSGVWVDDYLWSVVRDWLVCIFHLLLAQIDSH